MKNKNQSQRFKKSWSHHVFYRRYTGEHYMVHTSACDIKVGYMLLQEQPGKGKQPLSYWSRSLTKVRKAHDRTHRESMSVYMLIDLFIHRVLGLHHLPTQHFPQLDKHQLTISILALHQVVIIILDASCQRTDIVLQAIFSRLKRLLSTLHILRERCISMTFIVKVLHFFFKLATGSICLDFPTSHACNTWAWTVGTEATSLVNFRTLFLAKDVAPTVFSVAFFVIKRFFNSERHFAGGFVSFLNYNSYQRVLSTKHRVSATCLPKTFLIRHVATKDCCFLSPVLE